MSAERGRLEGTSSTAAGEWKQWGPYLAERAWGTVREDYSEKGTAWEYFPHDHARSRAYRWNEDGLAGISDLHQLLCFALALWNGRDPILKERIFGLTGNEGNHGEDAKEYWWYLDSTPTHSWMRWRYHYPQGEFPYALLVNENARRGRGDPEFELLDTSIFDDDRYWVVTVDYAKAAPDDLCILIEVTNAGPDTETLHVLPTLWFRNTWAWAPGATQPVLRSSGNGVSAWHPTLGEWSLALEPDPDDDPPLLLFCENETNSARLFGTANTTPYPKDGIGDHVIHGADSVNVDQVGTKSAAWYRLSIPGGGKAQLRLRLRANPDPASTDLGDDFTQVVANRRFEADQYYDELVPTRASAEEAMILRQAAAGLLWTKQFYHYDVEQWLDGDPVDPPPPAARLEGRNSRWRHLNNEDVLSVPDKWEYPWYAAWDLAFHCVALARLDPEMAKHQLDLLCREWYMHPSGQLPAYELTFDDVNPPVHAWAALRVFEIDGGDDYQFLERIFHKLMINFTWWVNREDALGNNVFQGGFLGLDNIGPFDRSAHLPVAGHLEQCDGTAWMAMYCLNLVDMALILACRYPVYENVATKFFEHFAYISTALNDQGLWDEEDGFYYDVLRCADGTRVPLKARSMVGLVSLFAVAAFSYDVPARLPDFARRVDWFVSNKPHLAKSVMHFGEGSANWKRLLSVASPECLARLLVKVFDEGEFFSPWGLRSLSAYHRDHPLTLELGGSVARLDYEPGESAGGLFGGNSNWRGPIWLPLNYLAIESLHRYHRCLGDDFTVELPTGSGNRVTLIEAAGELRDKLIGLFRNDAAGRRPCFGTAERFQTDTEWHDLLLFHEYFHADTGAGLGASHQTGWTALVIDLILEPPEDRRATLLI